MIAIRTYRKSSPCLTIVRLMGAGVRPAIALEDLHAVAVAALTYLQRVLARAIVLVTPRASRVLYGHARRTTMAVQVWMLRFIPELDSSESQFYCGDEEVKVSPRVHYPTLRCSSGRSSRMYRAAMYRFCFI